MPAATPAPPMRRMSSALIAGGSDVAWGRAYQAAALDGPLDDQPAPTSTCHASAATCSQEIGRPRNRRTTSICVVVCAVGRTGPERPAAAQRERQEQLIGQVSAHRHVRLEVGQRLGHGPLGDQLGAHAALAEAGEELGHVLAVDLDLDHVARSGRILHLERRAAGHVEAHPLAHHVELAAGHLERDRREHRPHPAPTDRAALEEIEPAERGRAGDGDREATAAGRVEAGTVERRRHLGAHPARAAAGTRGPGSRRSARAGCACPPSRTSVDGDGASEQRRQHGLQHQRGAAGGADREAIVAGAQPRRAGTSASREPSSAPVTSALADRGRGLDRGQVLAQQPGLRARPARMFVDPERLPGHQRQRRARCAASARRPRPAIRR